MQLHEKAADLPAQTSAGGLHELIVETVGGGSRSVPLAGNRLSVGRSPANELAFVEDHSLSRNHLVFERGEEGWMVKDLGSTNGTEVNAQRLRAPHLLRPGDQIVAGNQKFQFRSLASDQPSGTVFFVRDDTWAGSAELVVKLENVVAQGAAQKSVAPAAVYGKHAVDALIRAGRELLSHRSLSELFEVILDLALESCDAQRGVVMSLEGAELAVRAQRGEGFRISTAVRDRVIQEKASILVRDAFRDDQLRMRQSIVLQKVRSMMVVPLQTGDKVIGLIYIDKSDFINPFTDQELNLLTVMANVAAIRIEQARLVEVEQAERELSRELAQAGEIQASLLPKQIPHVEGMDISGSNIPCRGVGGDYFDCLPFRDGRVALLVGDVSGKGMPAALLMTSLQAMVSVLIKSANSPAEIMETLNRNLSERFPGNRFITLFIAVVDPFTGGIYYSNAGHNRPVLVRADGRLESLKGGDLVIGIDPKAKYQTYRSLMMPGDVLALYSDGITEASPEEEFDEFGEERLGEVLAQHRTDSASSLIERVVQAVSEHAGGGTFADDVTLLIARRVDEPQEGEPRTALGATVEARLR
ncbi:MAG: SpoIIE family protein phosphatase [Bryobacteraceae bacterium]|nr:SpoIIE family protein phosphatase [Bryobacteraceae bacterium]